VRRLLWGPERVWLLSRLSLRRRVLSGSVCSRCFAADVQPVLDLQTLLLAVAGEAPTAGGVIRLVDAAPLALHAPRMLDCMYAQQILLLAWPPRPMPVRQSWVESVLASGGYGSYSIQFNGIYFLSLRAGQRAPAAAAAADTAFLRYSCTVCMSAHSTQSIVSLVYYLEIL
jgi:hypothetical protein